MDLGWHETGGKAFRERSGENNRTHGQQQKAIPAEGGHKPGRDRWEGEDGVGGVGRLPK